MSNTGDNVNAARGVYLGPPSRQTNPKAANKHLPRHSKPQPEQQQQQNKPSTQAAMKLPSKLPPPQHLVTKPTPIDDTKSSFDSIF